MTGPDDDNDDMARSHSRSPGAPFLDELTAERLVAGTVDPGDVPPAYAPLVRLLHAATEPGHGHEIEGEDAVLRMFASERGALGAPSSPATSTPSPRSRPLGRRVAVAVVAGSLLLGGGAAAATGHLPDRAQAAAHDTLANIGLDVPDAPDDRPREDDEVGTNGGDPDRSGRDTDTPVCTRASDGRCKAGQQGRTEDRGSNGGDEPADPGAVGGAPGSVGPPSSTPATPAESTPGESEGDEKAKDEKSKDDEKAKDEKPKPGKPKDDEKAKDEKPKPGKPKDDEKAKPKGAPESRPDGPPGTDPVPVPSSVP
jgi:hypothetical protein